MKKIRIFVGLVGCLALSGTLSLLFGQTPNAGVEQQLRSQYHVTSVGNNGVVIRPGSVLVVQLDGISALPAPNEWPCNAYKLGIPIKQTALCAINWSPSKPNIRQLQVGERLYLTAIQVKPTDVAFTVQTIVDNDIPFRAVVSFQFQKGYLDSMKFNEIQDAIGHIFAPETSAPGSDQSPSGAAKDAQQPALCAQYFMERTDSQLQLNPDGSFSMRAANGQISPGNYSVNGDQFILTYNATGKSAVYKIQGDKMFATTGASWAPQGTCTPVTITASAPAPPDKDTVPAPVPAAPLKLPSTYVSSQSPDDHLQLNADNSFSLQEGGQSYHGNFVVTGNTLELTISDGTKNTVSLHGNNLVDSSGQTWAYRDQPIQSAPAADMLKNTDVLKMTKAGFDDETIIAKIKTSKCQFDTSPDALILLKQGGVHPAVLKAMIGAGK